MSTLFIFSYTEHNFCQFLFLASTLPPVVIQEELAIFYAANPISKMFQLTSFPYKHSKASPFVKCEFRYSNQVIYIFLFNTFEGERKEKIAMKQSQLNLNQEDT